jgi:hypothetical protein
MLAVRTILHPTDFSERSRYAYGLGVRKELLAPRELRLDVQEVKG